MRPSFIGAGMAAIVAAIAIFSYLINYKTLTTEGNIELLLLISIALSLHALTHHVEEIYHDFNPFANKWWPKD